MTATKKNATGGVLLLVGLGMLLVSGCRIKKADYETRQQANFAASAHADNEAEAFRHWDAENPAVVPTGCAKCHSVGGFIEFATAGAVTATAAPGAFTCRVCHLNEDGGDVRTFAAGVTFPSGAVITDAGSEAICMQCHQGRTSYKDIDAAIAGVGLDTSSSKLRFANIHYLAAAASMYGTRVKGGYEYSGNTYDAKFAHIAGYGACTDCHDPHSLEVKVENCATCHAVVRKRDDLKNIRWYGSLTDYDGDGNTSEGIYYEVEGVKARALTAIRFYAVQVAGTPIAYSAAAYPYWFRDTNGNGEVDSDETASYNAYTPRLLKACYNFHMATKDPGGFAHGSKYIIELLYDSMADLSVAIPTFTATLAGMHRTDEGHFDGSGMPWRDWDDSGTVPATCARCHSATGLKTFLDNGSNTAAPSANGMLCTTCHSAPPTLYNANQVVFPSGRIASLPDSSNLCMICHQGRAARKTVDDKIAGTAPYTFSNIHYFPAAAVFFGSDVQGGYEYGDKNYVGKSTFPNHEGKFNTCVQCHMGSAGQRNHNVAEPKKENCVACHGQDIAQPSPGADPAAFSFEYIRPASIPDFDGDGNTHESIKYEILGLEAALYARIQAYCSALGKPIAYNTDANPYWFKDTNGNGMADADESTSANAYKFDAKSLKAAFNYQVSHKEPHGFIHNAWYIAQLLVDSIGDLGGSVAPYSWR